MRGKRGTVLLKIHFVRWGRNPGFSPMETSLGGYYGRYYRVLLFRRFRVRLHRAGRCAPDTGNFSPF